MDECASASSLSARGARSVDVDVVSMLKKEIEEFYDMMVMVFNEKIWLV